MLDIKNEKQLWTWLKKQRHEVAIVIATRAALRLVPLMADYASEQPKNSAAIILASFRAIAAPWFAGTWSSRDVKFSDASNDAANNAYAVAAEASATTYATASATAYAAAAAADSAADSHAAAAADAIATAAYAADVGTTTTCWGEIEKDSEAVEAGLALHELIRQPLWGRSTPSNILVKWLVLNRALLELDEDWQVWTEWYDDRLRGTDDSISRPLIEELELERVLIPDKEWEKGAKHVNTLIAAMELEYRAEPPPQRSAIIEVAYGNDGKLHRRPSQPPRARNEVQAERLRAAWDAHSDQLATLEAMNPGANSPAFGAALKHYRAALGVTFED